MLRRAASTSVDTVPCCAGAAHQIDGLVDVEGLGQIFEGASLIRRHRCVQVRVRGHYDDRQARPRPLNFLEQVQAAAPGHADVRHQHIRHIGAQRRDDIVGLIEAPRGHAAAFQRLLEHPANGGIVVDQPDLQGLRVHWESIGREMTKIVLPGVLSNSIRPPWRLTRSCAMPKPRPVPSALPDTRG